ncbi:U1 small nuclear ribonucleoprotein 70 kDa-like [Oppia nitens]|uniref:U1 small nuclear ribonucleoprotein 70 kDa-like n=1 Tax=Oppia nitens TaxID=1686743 RepID=UPI0023DADB73|nr:U1 small nuclear ribonucleoprotein 70 kDa-like [Oppia nitens]
MTQYLPPNLLALFAPRESIPYLPPAQKLPHEKKTRGYEGVGHFLTFFEDPKDTPVPVRHETREERIERKRRERAEQSAYKLEQGIALWDPQSSTTATSDPYKTLFVARINFDTTESKLRREFEAYGNIKKIMLVQDKVTSKPRGYAYIEFEHERDMHSAYKHADGKKIDGRRVLVDVERGRTVKGWLPRRLGGGLGGTRKGAPDENIRHSGRDDGRTEDRDKYEKESRRHSRDRERSERKRSKSRERERRDDKRKRSRSRERERDRSEKTDRDRKRDRDGRDGRYDNRSERRSDRTKSSRDASYIEDQTGGGDLNERIERSDRRRGDSRDKDVERRKRRRSRSHSRDRKRSNRQTDYENNSRDKIDRSLDPMKNDLIKEEPEEGLYENDMYDNDNYQSGYGDSNSGDNFGTQSYSQPTYVNYKPQEDIYSP